MHNPILFSTRSTIIVAMLSILCHCSSEKQENIDNYNKAQELISKKLKKEAALISIERILMQFHVTADLEKKKNINEELSEKIEELKKHTLRPMDFKNSPLHLAIVLSEGEQFQRIFQSISIFGTRPFMLESRALEESKKSPNRFEMAKIPSDYADRPPILKLLQTKVQLNDKDWNHFIQPMLDALVHNEILPTEILEPTLKTNILHHFLFFQDYGWNAEIWKKTIDFWEKNNPNELMRMFLQDDATQEIVNPLELLFLPISNKAMENFQNRIKKIHKKRNNLDWLCKPALFIEKNLENNDFLQEQFNKLGDKNQIYSKDKLKRNIMEFVKKCQKT